MLIRKTGWIIVFSLICFQVTAQNNPDKYSRAWHKIDSLLSKAGLPQSALTEVNKLYQLAKTEKNDGQLIKALVYRLELEKQRQENGLEKSILALEKEIAGKSGAPRAILQTILATAYQQYLQYNRYKLYNRTATTDAPTAAIHTWDISTLHRKIQQLYAAALSNTALLQQTRLKAYQPVILSGNVSKLRPSLYDLLAHTALQYLKSEEPEIQQPAYAFKIETASAFDPAADFIHRKFPAKDSTALQRKALLLYQQLIRFHLSDKDPEALIDVDLERLAFVNEHAVHENKTDYYRMALNHIAAQYGNHPGTQQAAFLLAASYAETSVAGSATSTSGYQKAVPLLEKIIAAPDSSEGKINALRLLANIKQQSLSLQIEKVNLPAQPFRVLLTYRNSSRAYFRLIRITEKLRDQVKRSNSWREGYWPAILAEPAIKEYHQALPETMDYLQHRVELKIDPLDPGEYLLLTSTDPGFIPDKSAMAAQVFYVSSIGYLKQGNDYFVVDRESGRALARSAVQVWYRYYDYPTQKYLQRMGESLVTDKNGFFRLYPAQTTNNYNYRLSITNGNDRLFLDDELYAQLNTGSFGNPEDRLQTFLFTDRSIYRPGQEVFFKGLVLIRNQETGISDIVPDLETTVYLIDANGQRQDSLRLTTGAYGSYQGKFRLPIGMLNGHFQLQDKSSHGSLSFSVEEYKRPNFSVELEKPEGTYRLNDSISLTGMATAYAGNTISGAKVSYQVIRRANWPIWYGGYGGRKSWPPQQRQSVEIAHGETSTTANGKFTVRFKAIPDAAIDPASQVSFYYEINATITDLNGESRSGATSLTIAYQSINLGIQTPKQLPADSLRQWKISTKNQSDRFVATRATLTLYQLQPPERQFRSRYWEAPDQFLFSEETYHQLFPFDIYNAEDQVDNWPKLGVAGTWSDSTRADGGFGPATLKLQPGWYKAEAFAIDQNGDTARSVEYIELTGNKGSLQPNFFLSIHTGNDQYEAGTTVPYALQTNLDSVWAIHQISRPTGAISYQFIELPGGSYKNQLAITDTDRGGVLMKVDFIRHNRYYTQTTQLQVPFTNKQLQIRYESFRDKTLPGAAEKWKVKISGYHGDRVAAELLTAMYDASLDQFMPQHWQLPAIWHRLSWPPPMRADAGFGIAESINRDQTVTDTAVHKQYDELLSYQGYGGLNDYFAPPVMASRTGGQAQEAMLAAPMLQKEVADTQIEFDKAEEETAAPQKEQGIGAMQVRKNFSETAFFFPELHTDSNGSVEFSFTTPDALTQWKWMSLAHTKDLAFAYEEKKIITQKELMVQPNPPRFFREGDRMDFTTKIANLTDKELTGQVELQLIDPDSGQPVDGWFRNFFPNQYFTAAAGQSAVTSFTIEIPFQYNKPVLYRLIARSGNVSDAEERLIPVISNRMLVTETLPLQLSGTGTRNFKFPGLLASDQSQSLEQHSLTIEFTSNPAWYAVMALPYLMEYPYECAEQSFNRFYANTLASSIIKNNARIKNVFESWNLTDSAQFLSKLDKNPELKAVLLQETPWVFAAASETGQRKNLALLFDLARMSREQERSITKLKNMQSQNGGFVWFMGGPDDRYMTQYILSGIGHLIRLKALPADDAAITALIKKGLKYLDGQLIADYEKLVNSKAVLTENHISNLQIQYLYMRSFFTGDPVPGNLMKAYTYYRKQAAQFWLPQSRYLQGMIALSLHRTGDPQTARNILKSLRQHAIQNEETGMYWKEYSQPGYYWYQSPIEAHSLLTEAFSEIEKDNATATKLRTWLLKQKQTQHWKTTRATAEACYVLLAGNDNNWLEASPQVEIGLAGKPIYASKLDAAEAGSGYIKKVIAGNKVTPEMGNIQVTLNGTANQPPSWGAAYWQYFESLENIKPAAGPLKLARKMYIQRQSDKGPVLELLKAGDALQVGDLIKVRIDISSDRNLEYVHLKDMRASGLEPVNVISQYKWQGGLGYYESTSDVSTHFFFNYLPKGNWVFEYPLYVTHTGTFSNGISSIQCMYAPEFAAHSEGAVLRVE